MIRMVESKITDFFLRSCIWSYKTRYGKYPKLILMHPETNMNLRIEMNSQLATFSFKDYAPYTPETMYGIDIIVNHHISPNVLKMVGDIEEFKIDN